MNTSLTEMEELVGLLAQSKSELEKLAEAEKEVQKTRRDIEGKIMAKLKEIGNTGYLSSIGRVDIRTSLSYKTPKEMESKKKLFDYIKAKGEDVYIALLSVNSQTLNAWAKAETKAAAEANIFPFEIPGLEEPISYETIAFRKS